MTTEDSCADIHSLLLEYALGHLPAIGIERVERHLAMCAACRAELEQWHIFGALMAEVEARVPADEYAVEGWNQLRAHLRVAPRKRLLGAHSSDEPGRTAMKRATHLDWPEPSGIEPGILNARKSHRSRPLVALLAAAALVALSVAIFSVFGGPGRLNPLGADHGHATATPAPCALDQYQVRLPAHGSIASIAMVSPEEGWAVGTVWDPEGTTPPSSLILHLRRCVWSPVGDALPATSLLSVSVGANGEGWAVGATQKRDSLPLTNEGTGTRNDYLNDQLVVLHLTQGQWRRETIAGNQSVGEAKVQMIASGGWMLLDHGKQTRLVGNNPVSTYSYTLLRYTGSQWSPVPLDFKTPTTIISDMSAVSPQEVWFAGYGTGPSDNGALVARYSNGAWKTWHGNISGVQNVSLYHIVARSGEDVYASGTSFHHIPGNDYSTLLVLHFDGTTWGPAALPGNANANAPGGILYQTQPTGLAITPTGDVWSFSSTFFPSHTSGGYDTLMLREHAGVWQVADPGLAPNVAFVSGLTMATATRGWAIANTYAQTDIGAIPVGQLVLLDGTSWKSIPEQQP